MTQIKHAAVGRLEVSIGQQEIGVERVGPLIFLLQRVFFGERSLDTVQQHGVEWGWASSLVSTSSDRQNIITISPSEMPQK